VKRITLEDIGEVRIPDEFAAAIPDPERTRTIGSGHRADEVLRLLSEGWTVIVNSGDYDDLRILVWYLMKFKERLAPGRGPGREARRQRQAEILEKAHRLMILVKGGEMLGIEGQPDLSGLPEWVSWETDSSMPCMVPARRIARILTDMRRSRDGTPIKALGAPILVLPQVYVPFDQTTLNLLDEHLKVEAGDDVLDVGTGTGVLALVAARKGARKVVATDILDKAVENARLNVRRLDLSEVVEVRDAGNLFEPAPEQFDVIIFNPPWIVGEPRTTYDRAIYDPGGSVLSGFMSEVTNHLREGGRIYIIHSEISHSPGDRSLLQRLVEEKGMRISASWDARRRSRVTGSWERVRLLEIRIDH